MKKFREFLDLKKQHQAAAVSPSSNGQPALSTTPPGPKMLAAPSSSDQYRFRRFEGVNMGSWFVNEEWICSSVFANAASPGQSDLDICKGSNAKANLEKHWDNWITTSDWEFIVNQGLNTIRLPIGYYHLSQASVIANTDFGPYGTVFSGAWQRVLNAISTAKSYGLGVLVDLHAAPGGQNTQAHSGTSTGKANLWGNSTNLARCLSTLQFLVTNLQGIDNVVGVELLNEPQNGDYLAGWYVDTIQALRKISSDFPLYIHDGFDPQYYAKFVGSRTDLGYVVQDTHYYRCFTSSDTSESADDISQDVIDATTGIFQDIATWSKGHIICGEWSAALAPNSLDQSSRSDNSSRGYFAYVQLAMFKADIAGGWMFWTLHKESGTDTGWSLKDARAANTVPSDFSNYLVEPSPSNTANGTAGSSSNQTPVDKQATMRAALQVFQKKLADSNVGYEYPNLENRPADPTSPVKKAPANDASGTHSAAQSELFRQGFEQGYEDARAFLAGLSDLKAVSVPTTSVGKDATVKTRTVGGYSIGHLDHWKKLRTVQFLDANATSGSSSTVPGSLWDSVLRLLRLRSGAKAGSMQNETRESKLARGWEYTDGFEQGVKAFEVVKGIGNSDAIKKWGLQMKNPK